jgi:hypothetical protein
VLAVGTALAQVIDYQFFDSGLRALDANTHRSIFGAVSLLANAVAVALAILLAVRARNRELIILSAVLAAMFALRVTYPSHLLLLSLPLTGIALVILWGQGRPSAGEGLWTIRAGCSLLVVSFALHALEVEPLPGLLSAVSATSISTSWVSQVRSLTKHEAELVAWIMITAGLLNLRSSNLRRGPEDTRKPPGSRS